MERGRSLGQLRTKRAASTLFLSFDLSKTGSDGSSSVPQIVRPHCSHILSKPVRVKKKQPIYALVSNSKIPYFYLGLWTPTYP